MPWTASSSCREVREDGLTKSWLDWSSVNVFAVFNRELAHPPPPPPLPSSRSTRRRPGCSPNRPGGGPKLRCRSPAALILTRQEEYSAALSLALAKSRTRCEVPDWTRRLYRPRTRRLRSGAFPAHPSTSGTPSGGNRPIGVQFGHTGAAKAPALLPPAVLPSEALPPGLVRPARSPRLPCRDNKVRLRPGPNYLM
ncbi:hypothetical protein LX36DRAFT_452273 [Colletotrichum falcatum]|nr:hypothetical protein LX36DRAFT_452273 [Colletotrichum falcatum]